MASESTSSTAAGEARQASSRGRKSGSSGASGTASRGGSKRSKHQARGGQQTQAKRASNGANGNGGGLMSRSMSGIRDASSKAAESVKEHPIPALIVGAGLGYLAAYGLRKTMPADGIGEALSGTAESVKEGATRLGEYAGEGISTVGSALKSAGSTVGEEIEHGYEATRDALSETWDRHPLMVCAAVLAAGAAAGFLLPRTHAEDQSLGK